MIVGLTSGCFDLIHYGHVRYLRRCKSLCDRLIVGIDSDEMVRAAKGDARPLIPELERWELVQSLGIVDTSFILRALADLDQIARAFQVKKVFKHQGFAHLDHVVGVHGTGAELVIVPDEPGLVSTSEIIARVRSR